MIYALIALILVGMPSGVLILPNILARFAWGRAIIYPRVVIDAEKCVWGLGNRNWAFRFVLSCVVAFDGVTTAILSAMTNKKVVWIYRPVRTTFVLPWPKDAQPSPGFRAEYVGSAGKQLTAALEKNGWRSWLYRGIAAIPRKHENPDLHYVDVFVY